jgi:hypothetical protein
MLFYDSLENSVALVNFFAIIKKLFRPSSDFIVKSAAFRNESTAVDNLWIIGV